MFAQIEHPQDLKPDELDQYLAGGWFRMRQTIFTTNFLHFNQQFYSAVWLRISLGQPILDTKYQRLQKLNKSFQIEIRKSQDAGTDYQHEMLYRCYRQSISFEVSPTLRELLYGNEAHNRFNTFEVNVYDKDLLIAAGFFDMGSTSAAGITCLYHPDYKKFSLGKYLMYLKMEYCRQQQLQFFYPGYIVPGYASFNYKLEIGKASLQFLQLSSQRWVPYTSNNDMPSPLQEMQERLTVMHECLDEHFIPQRIFYYKFFEANLDPYYYSNNLFDFPVFLLLAASTDPLMFNIIVFDVRDGMYHLIQCSSVISTGFQPNAKLIFDADLLKIECRLFSSSCPLEVCAWAGCAIHQYD